MIRVRHWSKHYGDATAAKWRGPLPWVKLPTGRDSLAFRRIAARPDRSDVFSVWILCLQIAAAQPSEDRGKVFGSGHPLSCAEISLLTGWPEDVIQRSISVLVEVGWLECDELADFRRPSEDLPKTFCAEIEKEEEKEEDLYPPKSAARRKEKPLEIYGLYPRKVGKASALRAIGKALKTVSAEILAEKTRAYAEAVKSWPPGDERFIPHPATWFNDQRYDDDPATWSRRAQSNVGSNARGFALAGSYAGITDK